MKEKICLLFFLIVAAFLSLGTTSAFAEDTVFVASVNDVPSDTTITVDVKLKIDHNVDIVVIPIQFMNEDNTGIDCDSIHFSEWFWEAPAADYTGKDGERQTINNDDKWSDSKGLPAKSVRIYATWIMPHLYMEPRDTATTLVTLYFTTDEFWRDDIGVEIDTFLRPDPPTVELELALEGAPSYPEFLGGLLGPQTWVREVDLEEINLPEEFFLAQNYPNPFNPTTQIRFALPEDSWVKVEVFNILGQKITTLVDEHLTAGYKETGWDGKDSKGMEVASGIYFYRIETKSFTDIKKMVLLK